MNTLQVPLILRTGQSSDTSLSPHCNTIAKASFDLNDSTNVTFLYLNQSPLWTTLVSTGIQVVTLDEEITNADVRLCKGLKISFNPMGPGLYTVTLDGRIIDTDTVYPLVGTNIGTFQRGSTLRDAIRPRCLVPAFDGLD